jgi:serine/threonine-protein kinase
MSRVFVAEEVALGRRVVIKVLPPDTAAEVNADRFRREIQLAAQLQHPAIVPLLTAGAQNGLLWFVMPFVDGMSLRERLSRSGPLSLDEAVRFWRDLLEALEYAHSRNIIHRDIKPENLMLSGRHAQVLDFGVAKAVSASTGVTHAGMTGLGMAIGTPAYMAPEQVAAESTADGRLDLYAAALVMYEMLAGRRPFDGERPSEIMAAHVATPAPPVSLHRADAPPSLVALVMQCLEKSPAKRPASATEALQRLDAMTAELSGARTPSATATSASTVSRGAAKAPTRSRVPLVASAAVLFALVSGSVYWQRSRATARGAAAPTAELADRERLSVMVYPAVFERGDSVLASSMTDALTSALKADTRVLTYSASRATALGEEFGMDRTTMTKDSLTVVARDLGMRATVQPSLARVGEGFVLSADVVATAGDSALFRAEVPVSTASDVPQAMKTLSERVRNQLGPVYEKLGDPQPVGRLFTTVREAASLFTEAVTMFDDVEYRGAIARLQQAVVLDSTFAVAWSLLATCYGNLGVNPDGRTTALRMADRYADKSASKWQRSLNKATYLRAVGRNQEAIAALQQGARTDRGLFDGITENELALNYSALRQPDLAARYYERGKDATRRAPGVTNRNLIIAQLEGEQFEAAAREVALTEKAAGATNVMAARMRAELAFASGDIDSARAATARWLAASKTSASQFLRCSAVCLSLRANWTRRGPSNNVGARCTPPPATRRRC